MTNAADKPKMYILAGPNGSGKTSYFLKRIPKGVTVLNADKFSRKIAKEQGIPDDEIQDAVNKSDALKLAGMRELTTRMQECIDKRESFSPETTLNTNGYERYINSAKSNGFEVEMWYMGTESPRINLDRIPTSTV